MEFKTHREDSNGQNVMLGDVLSSDSTSDVVVKLNDEKNIFIVQIIEYPDIWFTLDEFMDAWRSSIVVTNNINLHVKSK